MSERTHVLRRPCTLQLCREQLLVRAYPRPKASSYIAAVQKSVACQSVLTSLHIAVVQTAVVCQSVPMSLGVFVYLVVQRAAAFSEHTHVLRRPFILQLCREQLLVRGYPRPYASLYNAVVERAVACLSV